MCTLLTQNICLMCHTQVLRLGGNQIGDAGLDALAKAVESGALASLKKIVVDTKHLRRPQLVAACQPRGIQIA